MDDTSSFLDLGKACFRGVGAETCTYLGVLLDDKLNAPCKKRHSMPYFRMPTSFNICDKLSLMFYQSDVASAILAGYCQPLTIHSTTLLTGRGAVPAVAVFTVRLHRENETVVSPPSCHESLQFPSEETTLSPASHHTEEPHTLMHCLW